MPRFHKIGPALRFLRLYGGREPRKQLEIAERADVTRGMLSSYERGHQEPTLKSLDRVLDALEADLPKLQWALQRVEPGGTAGAAGDALPPTPPHPHLPDWRTLDEVAEPTPGSRAVYRTVQVPEPLDSDEERALGEMVSGFLAYLRYTRGRREDD